MIDFILSLPLCVFLSTSELKSESDSGVAGHDSNAHSRLSLISNASGCKKDMMQQMLSKNIHYYACFTRVGFFKSEKACLDFQLFRFLPGTFGSEVAFLYFYHMYAKDRIGWNKKLRSSAWWSMFSLDFAETFCQLLPTQWLHIKRPLYHKLFATLVTVLSSCHSRLVIWSLSFIFPAEVY